MKDIKKLLLKIGSICGKKFTYVKDNKAYHLEDDKQIPVDHIIYQKMPEDGYYELAECTCGGTCKVGDPSTKCGVYYSPRKCCVYEFWNIEEQTFSLTLDNCRELAQFKGNDND